MRFEMEMLFLRSGEARAITRVAPTMIHAVSGGGFSVSSVGAGLVSAHFRSGNQMVERSRSAGDHEGRPYNDSRDGRRWIFGL